MQQHSNDTQPQHLPLQPLQLNYSRISKATAVDGKAPVDRSYVSKILRGKANATAAVIRRIAVAMEMLGYNVSGSELLRMTSNGEPKVSR